MSSRIKDTAAMKERLRQMSQAASTVDGPLPGLHPDQAPPRSDTDASGAPMPEVTPPRLPPLVPADATRKWRSQGITVYDMDDERLERLAAFFKARGVRFGRRGQISLLAGAGIAALERLLAVDPTSLLAIVESTMQERRSKSATTN